MGCSSDITKNNEDKVVSPNKRINNKNNQIIQKQQINKNYEIKKKELDSNNKIIKFEQNNEGKSIQKKDVIKRNKSKEINNKEILNINQKESNQVTNKISFKCFYEINIIMKYKY